MSDINDEPAFPVQDASTWQAHGMTKRELIAAILMHGELVTCGVPGQAADALVQASEQAGDDLVDHMAGNAVEAAEALLRRLEEPRPQEYRPLYTGEQMQLDAALRLANLVNAVADRPEYMALPEEQREAIKAAISDVLDPEIPF